MVAVRGTTPSHPPANQLNMARATLSELSRLFLKLGIFGFGGPAAHIATMEEEVVQRKKWLDEQQFLDLIGATNLIPGPNSTELAIHIGYHQRGWRGLFVAGGCFVLPAILITGLFAWLYVEYGQLPETEPLMAGIQPTVLAIILIAGWRLGKKALRGKQLPAIALVVAVVSWFLPGREVLILLASSVIGALLVKPRAPKSPPADQEPPPAQPAAGSATMLVSASTATTTATAVVSTSPSVAMIGWIFLKVGAVLYGSGYVLIAYLEGELVHQRGWLTSNQLLDAIAIGQFTPGPILSTATFIGYLVMADQGPLLAIAGAVTATIGIFLPAFLLVGITSPWVSKLRSHRTLSKFLDAVNAASMGLMAAVVVRLGQPTLFPEDASSAWTTPCRLLIVGVAMLLVFRYRVSPILVIASGLVLGLLLGQWLV